MAYSWDQALGRYRDAETGLFLSRDAVYGMVNQSISATQLVTDHLAASVADGSISAEAWHLAMKGEIKREYIRQYLLGHGGRHEMTPADWGRLGPMIREQYQFLGGFYDAVRNGELSEAQIRVRAGDYINSAREGYERARIGRAYEYGMSEEIWRLGSSAQHCGDCVSFAEAGWLPIGSIDAMPGDGSTQCLSRCACFKEYRSADGRLY